VSESSAVAVATPRRAKARGWWGMALFAATESTLFGTIVGTYFYLRFKSAHWPPAGIPEPRVVLPIVLTAVLVATSVPMQAAYRAARAGRAGAALLALLAALAVQAAYLGVQLDLYVRDLASYPPRRHAYASITHLMVGADHAHVAVGLLLDLFLLAKLVDGRVTAYRLVGLQSAAFYWHVVNLLTVVVVTVELSPRW
jgi:heme/copper-type cytochrome/quinol oxidase subunit 3